MSEYLLVLLLGDLPDLLESDAVALRIGILSEIELANHLFGARATHSLGEKGYGRVELETASKVGLYIRIKLGITEID